MIRCSLNNQQIHAGDVLELIAGETTMRRKVVTVEGDTCILDGGSRLSVVTDDTRRLLPPGSSLPNGAVFQHWPGRRRIQPLDSWDVVASFA